MLAEKLQRLATSFKKQVPQAALEVMAAATQAVADSIPGRNIPSLSDPLPAFELANSEGVLVDSKALVAKGRLIVSFFRGSW